MVQRIQTVYLALAFGISAGLSFVFPLWKNGVGENIMSTDVLSVLMLFLISAVLSLFTIFKFKNRQTQFVLGRLNIILNFILLGVIVYLSLTLSGETAVSEKGIGMILPLFSIVFIVLANKAIKKDEDLVKSVDRLR